jgi:peptidoglycan hydrolase-like protein with peptidoglycan-binding domain
MVDAKTIQEFLKTLKFYSGVIDGIFGPMSYSASRAALKVANVNAGTWTNDRVWIGINQYFLNEMNDAGLIVDGVMGQRTNDALYVYSTTLLHTIATNWPRQVDVRAAALQDVGELRTHVSGDAFPVPRQGGAVAAAHLPEDA